MIKFSVHFAIWFVVVCSSVHCDTKPNHSNLKEHKYMIKSSYRPGGPNHKLPEKPYHDKILTTNLNLYLLNEIYDACKDRHIFIILCDCFYLKMYCVSGGFFKFFLFTAPKYHRYICK